MPSLIEETALRVGQGFCDLAAAVLFGQFRCSDPEALAMVGYVVMSSPSRSQRGSSSCGRERNEYDAAPLPPRVPIVPLSAKCLR